MLVRLICCDTISLPYDVTASVTYYQKYCFYIAQVFLTIFTFYYFEKCLLLNLNPTSYLKGIWGQSNNFCLKWSFFTIKENKLKQKFQKFTCEPRLSYYVCLFAWMTSFAYRHCLINPYFVASRVGDKWSKTLKILMKGSFSFKLTQICK